MEMSKKVEKVIDLVECYVANNGDYLGQSVKPGRGWSRRFAELDIPNKISRREIFELVGVENGKVSDERNWKKYLFGRWRGVMAQDMALGVQKGY